jgi:hypothetical protein
MVGEGFVVQLDPSLSLAVAFGTLAHHICHVVAAHVVEDFRSTARHSESLADLYY